MKSMYRLLLVFAVVLLPAMVYGQAEQNSGDAGDIPSVVGTWSLAFANESADMEHVGEFTLQQKGVRLKGRHVSGAFTGTLMGSCTAEGEVFLKQLEPGGIVKESDEGQQRFRTTIEFRGSLSEDGKTVEGTYTATDVESGSVVSESRFRATRTVN